MRCPTREKVPPTLFPPAESDKKCQSGGDCCTAGPCAGGSSADFQSAVSPTSSRQVLELRSCLRIGNPRYGRLEVWRYGVPFAMIRIRSRVLCAFPSPAVVDRHI